MTCMNVPILTYYILKHRIYIPIRNSIDLSLSLDNRAGKGKTSLFFFLAQGYIGLDTPYLTYLVQGLTFLAGLPSSKA